jgi:hypothetical protein
MTENTRLTATVVIKIPIHEGDQSHIRQQIKDSLKEAIECIDGIDRSRDYELTCNFREEQIHPHADASIKWFNEHRDELLKDHYGEYVCLDYDKVLAFFPTHEEASESGYQLTSGRPFFIRHIVPEEEERVYSFHGGSTTKRELRAAGQDI